MPRWAKGAATAVASIGWCGWQLRSPAAWAAANQPLAVPAGWAALLARGALVALIVWCVMSLTTRLIAARLEPADPRAVFVASLLAAVSLVFGVGWNAVVADAPVALLAAGLASWALLDAARVWFGSPTAPMATMRMSAWLCALGAAALQPVWGGLFVLASATVVWRWWRGKLRVDWIAAVAAATIATAALEIIAWQSHSEGPLRLAAHAWRHVGVRHSLLPLLSAIGQSLPALLLACALVGWGALAVAKRQRSAALAVLLVVAPALLWRHGSSAAAPLLMMIAVLAALGVHALVAGIRFAPGRVVAATALAVVLLVPAFVL